MSRKDFKGPRVAKCLNQIEIGSLEIQVHVMVIQKKTPIIFPEHPALYNFVIADETGTMDLALYGSMGSDVDVGDIIYLKTCYMKIHEGRYLLNLNRNEGKILRVARFTKKIQLEPDLSNTTLFPHSVGKDFGNFKPNQQENNRNKPHLPNKPIEKRGPMRGTRNDNLKRNRPFRNNR